MTYMKRLILCFVFLSLCLAAQGQYVQRHGASLIRDGQELSSDEVRLLLSDVNGVDLNPSWNRARALRGTGMGLTIGGGIVLASGGAVFMAGALTSVLGVAVGATAGAIVGGAVGDPNTVAQEGAASGAQAGVPLMNAGLITCGVGIVALAVGIPMLVVNVNRMNQIAASCNVAPGGIGLSLRF